MRSHSIISAVYEQLSDEERVATSLAEIRATATDTREEAELARGRMNLPMTPMREAELRRRESELGALLHERRGEYAAFRWVTTNERRD